MALVGRFVKPALLHPLTVVAGGVVAALVAGFISWFQPPLVVSAGVVAVGLVLFLLWPVIFINSDAFAEVLLRRAKDLEPDIQKRLQELEAEFAELDFPQGKAQLGLLDQKIDNLTEVLRRRLSAGELTYSRYLDMAEQVYLSALDNLHEVAVSLRSVSTIDPGYIDQRLTELRGSRQPTEDQEREFTALQSRHELLETQQKRVAGLIAQNESAMTVLDKTATALADTKMGKGHAVLDSEAAMAELETLAKRVGKYAAAN